VTKATDGGGESKAHESGRRIVELKRKKKSDRIDDVERMKRVNGYVKRHLGQGPKKDPENSKWRYSLMNWGHNPLK
jgi:hypothetical protein